MKTAKTIGKLCSDAKMSRYELYRADNSVQLSVNRSDTDARLRKIFAPTSSLRLPHSTNFWQWSEEETMSWWDSWWEQKPYAILHARTTRPTSPYSASTVNNKL